MVISDLHSRYIYRSVISKQECHEWPYKPLLLHCDVECRKMTGEQVQLAKHADWKLAWLWHLIGGNMSYLELFLYPTLPFPTSCLNPTHSLHTWTSWPLHGFARPKHTGINYSTKSSLHSYSACPKSDYWLRLILTINLQPSLTNRPQSHLLLKQ